MADILKVSVEELIYVINTFLEQRDTLRTAFSVLSQAICQIDNFLDGEETKALKEQFDQTSLSITQSGQAAQDVIDEIKSACETTYYFPPEKSFFSSHDWLYDQGPSPFETR